MKEAFCRTLYWNSLQDERIDRTRAGYESALETLSSILGLKEAQFGDMNHTVADAAAGPFLERVSRSTEGQLLALRRKGYLAMGLETIKLGNIIAIFSGAIVPFVLRPIDDHFMVIGPCYVHGIMDGEAFTPDNQKNVRDFELH